MYNAFPEMRAILGPARPAFNNPRFKREEKPFRFEREMVSVLAKTLPILLNRNDSRHSFILSETTIGNLIPDLVVVKVGQNLRLPRRSFSHVEAHILTLIEKRRTLTVDEVIESLSLTDSGAFRAFQNIKKSGVIKETRDGKITFDTIPFTRAVQITAFELKLRRWRDALVQAQAYLSFADRVYVVLDGNQAKITTEIERKFRAASVGLLMQRGKSLDERVKAPRRISVTPERVQAVQKFCRVGGVET